MRFHIQGLGFPLTAPLLEHAARRLRYALTRTSDRIERVVVRLRDTKWQRGCEDKFCRGDRPAALRQVGHWRQQRAT